MTSETNANESGQPKDRDVGDKSVVMSRFLVFGGTTHYATGGFNDFIRSFSELSNAIEFANRPKFDESVGKWKYMRPTDWDWWHIYDSESRTIVAQSDHQAYGHENGQEILHDCSSS